MKAKELLEILQKLPPDQLEREVKGYETQYYSKRPEEIASIREVNTSDAYPHIRIYFWC